MDNEKIALLLTVGNVAGLPKAISDTKADLVYFIHTKKSLKTIEDVITELNQTVIKKNDQDLKEYMLSFKENETYFKIKLNSDVDLNESFIESRHVIRRLKREGYDVRVDFTGGTKVMGVGLYLAAMSEHCKYFYVKGKRQDDIGNVISGFEEIQQLEDPYETFAVREFNRGIQFFNSYQFDASLINFKAAHDVLEDDDLKERASLFMDIVKLYNSWDKFNNNLIEDSEITKIKLNKFLKEDIIEVIDRSENLTSYFNERNPEFYKQLKRNLKFLDKKISNKQSENFKDIKVYLPDLLNNAKRRIDEGKYDDAVARLYRASELVAQLKLVEYDFINYWELEKNLSFYVDKNKINAGVNSKTRRNLNNWKYYDKKGTVDTFALKKTYELLSRLNKDDAEALSQNFFDNIKDDINERNTSILAHGLKPIDKALADDLYDLVLDHSLKLYSNVEKYQRFAEFPKFNLSD
ncbi:TIGR02710 family CRISPR-associated CARF protein [uncultured Methanobrevibacter sp.]|uniref:TIGR02710 family CRISPR-associated CARF protein n=1 Tax=uncultured Methanobrevibacter sp. TaxID=253161 RepID=UPI00262F5433